LDIFHLPSHIFHRFGAVEAGFLGEGFLGQAALLAQGADIAAQGQQDGVLFHAAELTASWPISLRTMSHLGGRWGTAEAKGQMSEVRGQLAEANAKAQSRKGRMEGAELHSSLRPSDFSLRLCVELRIL